MQDSKDNKTIPHVSPVLPRCLMASRSMAPSGLTKALSFRVVELAFRDDDAGRSNPPARGQQWLPQQCLVPELVEQLKEVPKGRYHPAADCMAGCRSAHDLVPGVYRGSQGRPSGAGL